MAGQVNFEYSIHMSPLTRRSTNVPHILPAWTLSPAMTEFTIPPLSDGPGFGPLPRNLAEKTGHRTDGRFRHWLLETQATKSESLTVSRDPLSRIKASIVKEVLWSAESLPQ